MTSKQVDLTKNFFALGLMFWLYERSMGPTIAWIDEKFGGRPVIAEANRRALKAGYAFGETTEMFHTTYRVPKAKLPPGTYRNITGNEATALGFLAAAQAAKRDLFYGSYPITPATDILHQLAGYKSFGVRTFQAEDEIAAMGATIGAAYGGALALTGTSGPGVALKTEAMGLAVMTELPMVIVNVQRAGPSTGLPDQGRAGGPVPGDLRPQRRVPDAGARPGHARRVLHAGDRGVAHRAQVHDPGHVPLRRVRRQRRGALARPGRGRSAGHLGPQRRQGRGHVPARTAATRRP